MFIKPDNGQCLSNRLMANFDQTGQWVVLFKPENGQCSINQKIAKKNLNQTVANVF